MAYRGSRSTSESDSISVGLTSSERPSGSSAFTEEEIIAELRNMGYNLQPDQIAELKTELEKYDPDIIFPKSRKLPSSKGRARRSRASSSDGSQHQATPHENTQDLDSLSEQQPRKQLHPSQSDSNIQGHSHGQSSRNSERSDATAHSTSEHYQSHNLAQNRAPAFHDPATEATQSRLFDRAGTSQMSPEAEKLLNRTEQVLSLADDRLDQWRQHEAEFIQRFGKIAQRRSESETERSNSSGSSKENQRVMFADQRTLEFERNAMKELGHSLFSGVICGLEDREIQRNLLGLQRLEERRDPLMEQPVRPVILPEAGSLPYRHDPVKKYELYQKEWNKFPVPGEKKRLKLRWKVREYMLRQDIPLLKP